jgi:hypothetical protein
MRAKRRWAALAVTVGLLAGSVGGGIALGAGSSGDAMKKSGGDAMQQSSGSGDAMKQQGAAMQGAAMSAAHMTG